MLYIYVFIYIHILFVYRYIKVGQKGENVAGLFSDIDINMMPLDLIPVIIDFYLYVLPIFSNLWLHNTAQVTVQTE